MEEDAGKLTHVGGATGRIQGAEYSLVDYNRAGVPLVEIVTKVIYGAEADAPELAKAYVATIRDIVVALGISDARMERGNLRCDANVSLRPRGQEKLGTRTETKNVNSLRSVERAVRYEIQRQAQILSEGGTIIQETRHWHEDTGATSAGRPKSDADDYRYFPEPDLLPVEPSVELIEELRAALPEQPAERKRRLKAEWGFTDLEFQDVVNSGLLSELVATVARGESRFVRYARTDLPGTYDVREDMASDLPGVLFTVSADVRSESDLAAATAEVEARLEAATGEEWCDSDAAMAAKTAAGYPGPSWSLPVALAMLAALVGEAAISRWFLS
jgi:Asp-tRNA(Asn)/Glu-tRNA(Gln) amidotransferase B subunit